jgi:hypothetical protein
MASKSDLAGAFWELIKATVPYFFTVTFGYTDEMLS